MTTLHPSCIKGGACFLANLSDDAREMSVIDNGTIDHWCDCLSQAVEDLGLLPGDVWQDARLQRIADNLRALRREIAMVMRMGSDG